MDPITLEVITSSLTAYADEMTNSFWKSSYSYFNYEIRDFAVGYIDADGRIITHVPSSKKNLNPSRSSVFTTIRLPKLL